MKGYIKMSADIYFRTSLSGYNKNDVIKFIEKLNAEQIERVNELNDRIRSAQTEIRRLNSELDEAHKKCAELEEQLSGERSRNTANDEKAQKYDEMQGTYADIMLEAEHNAKEKVRIAQEQAEKIIADANGIKKQIISENKEIIASAKTEFTALVDKLTSSLDDTLEKLGNGENE